MTTERSVAVCLGIVSILCLFPFVSTADDSGYLEVSLVGGRHSNFFFRGPGAEAPASNLLRLLFDSERTKDFGRTELTWVGQASFSSVPDIDQADYQTAGTGVEIKRGATKFAVEYSRLLNRLYFESGDPVFFDANALDFWVRRSLGPKLWVRFEAELESSDFDPVEDARDSHTVTFGLTVRRALSDRIGLRASVEVENRNANGLDQNRDGVGLALALEGLPRDDLAVFARWRRRYREYVDAPPGSRNFNRDDTVDAFVFNLKWSATERWGLLFSDEYRTGDSTRPGRNYSGNQVMIGAFFRINSRSGDERRDEREGG